MICQLESCGKQLVQHKKEKTWSFHRRKTCGMSCASKVRAEARFGAAQRAKEAAAAPKLFSGLIEPLRLWHETVANQQPVGPARWWR